MLKENLVIKGLRGYEANMFFYIHTNSLHYQGV